MTVQEVSERSLAIIAARGGSKGLPRKNIRILGGRPLIAWTIEAALASPWVERVVVSTDDPEIADAAVRHGAEVPFLRPADLSTDGANLADVIDHALEWLKANEGYSPAVFANFTPTYPFRSRQIVNAVLEPVCRGDADFAVTVRERLVGPSTFVTLDGDRIVPCLAKERIVYEATGLLGAVSTRRAGGRRRYVPVRDPRMLIDIDALEDLELAERSLPAEVA